MSLPGKQCIEVTSEDKIAFISELLCIGCGICVKVCYYSVCALVSTVWVL